MAALQGAVVADDHGGKREGELEIDLLFRGLHSRFDTIDNRVRELHGDHLELSSRVTAVENRAELMERIANLHQDANRQSVDAVREALDRHNGEIGRLRDSFGQTAGRIIYLLAGTLLSVCGAFAILVINKVI